MRILFDNPKKVSWQLERFTWPDGRVHILMGSQHQRDVDFARNQAIGQGAVVDRIGNCVVETAIRLRQAYAYGHASFAMQERDGQDFSVGAAPFADFVAALQEGHLRLENGWMVGRFTFEKRGREVTLRPWSEARADAAEAGDAPDLSDVVAELGPATTR